MIAVTTVLSWLDYLLIFLVVLLAVLIATRRLP
jgi:hypothetical protein